MDWTKLLLLLSSTHSNSSNMSTYLHIFTCINVSTNKSSIQAQQSNGLWYHEYTQTSQYIFLETEDIHNNFNTVYHYQSLNMMSTSRSIWMSILIARSHACVTRLTQIQRENYDSIGQHQIKQQLSLYVRFCIFF